MSASLKRRADKLLQSRKRTTGTDFWRAVLKAVDGKTRGLPSEQASAHA